MIKDVRNFLTLKSKVDGDAIKDLLGEKKKIKQLISYIFIRDIRNLFEE